MTVIASVHIADVGATTAFRLRPPRGVAGLRHADLGLAALFGASIRPSPMLGRAGMIAFWDDEDALDRFLADHPLAARLAEGWSARLEPLRAFGDWPGLPADIKRDRVTDHDGPAIVLTLGQLRLRRAPRFLRTSAKAEAAALQAPGMVWATALARPPFVATCSVWDSTRALSTYAYGGTDPGHPAAIAADQARPFHRQSAFVRFRPISITGHLDGKNPIQERALDS
jgi:hypothetical protein